MSEATARRVVAARSQGRCEMCGVRAAQSWHHRQRRSQRGLWVASNGLHTCGDGVVGCHGKVTNTRGHAELYQRRGWIVPSWADPAAVPVWLANLDLGQVWCLLGDDGQVRLLSAAEADGIRARVGLMV